MNKNQTDGIGKQIKGAVKEGVSKVTGNTGGEIEGKIEKNVGKAQSSVGKAQEDARRDEERNRRN
jgi:uncharacterized protein YjbJ (UPF0337 family)